MATRATLLYESCPAEGADAGELDLQAASNTLANTRRSRMQVMEIMRLFISILLHS